MASRRGPATKGRSTQAVPVVTGWRLSPHSPHFRAMQADRLMPQPLEAGTPHWPEACDCSPPPGLGSHPTSPALPRAGLVQFSPGAVVRLRSLSGLRLSVICCWPTRGRNDGSSRAPVGRVVAVSNPMLRLLRLLGVLVVASVVAAVLAAALTEHTVQFVQANTMVVPDVEVNSLAQTSTVYASDGTLPRRPAGRGEPQAGGARGHLAQSRAGHPRGRGRGLLHAQRRQRARHHARARRERVVGRRSSKVARRSRSSS